MLVPEASLDGVPRIFGVASAGVPELNSSAVSGRMNSSTVEFGKMPRAATRGQNLGEEVTPGSGHSGGHSPVNTRSVDAAGVLLLRAILDLPRLPTPLVGSSGRRHRPSQV
ncbi:MAG: hypothetical protein ACRDTA_08570 [Pseudonocardiaceae bacterium]